MSDKPIIKGLAHVCFTVSDLDASIDFYVNKLGLTAAFEFVNDEGVKFGQYISVGGRNFLELFRGDLPQRAESQPYKHLCLEVDDLDASIEALQANGVEVTGHKLGTDRSWQAWITDPDGNRIELHCYTDQSKQNEWLS